VNGVLRGRHLHIQAIVHLADPLSGFDYYNARYYDPVAGVFLSADTVQGNMQGMNPYAYVNGNPETYTDPTGNMYAPPGGGGGGGNGGGGGTPPPSCQGWCWIQQQWNNFNNNVVHPVEHFVQQVPEVIIHDVVTYVPIIVPIVIGIVAAATIGGFAYAIWQLTHTNPNWSNVSAGQGVTHPRWVWKNREGKPGTVPSRGHVISSHVNITDSGMRDRARNPRNKEHTATRFYDEYLAQWTVDYALDHMSWAQKKQLLWMRTNLAGRFATLTLTGNVGMSIGEGWRYDPDTKQFTHLTNLSSYKAVIGIDFKTGQPFIITAFPTD